MIYSCWSLKGGTGTTSLATALALNLSREQEKEILLVDLAGDIPAVLGIASLTPVGIGDWLSVGENLEADSLKHLEFEVTSKLSLLPRGRAPLATLSQVLTPDALVAELEFQASIYAADFIKQLSADERLVIIDCGNLWDTALNVRNQAECQQPDLLFRREVCQAADTSWVFTRSCYLSLRRLASFFMSPDGVVFLKEANRSLTASDIIEIAGAPIAFGVSIEASVMNAIDSGLLSTRLPRRLEKMLVNLFANDIKSDDLISDDSASKASISKTYRSGS